MSSFKKYIWMMLQSFVFIISYSNASDTFVLHNGKDIWAKIPIKEALYKAMQEYRDCEAHAWPASVYSFSSHKSEDCLMKLEQDNVDRITKRIVEPRHMFTRDQVMWARHLPDFTPFNVDKESKTKNNRCSSSGSTINPIIDSPK